LHPVFSSNFFNENIKNELRQIKTSILGIEKNSQLGAKSHEQLALEQSKFKYIQKLSELINNLFNNQQNDALYIIAGRNSTVSYTEMFEKYLFTNIQNRLEDNRKQTFKKKEQTIDEILMLKFIERVYKIKGLFKKYSSFNGLINLINEDEKSVNLSKSIKIIGGWLKPLIKLLCCIPLVCNKICLCTYRQCYRELFRPLKNRWFCELNALCVF